MNIFVLNFSHFLFYTIHLFIIAQVAVDAEVSTLHKKFTAV